MSNAYSTVQGDMWDMISYRVYGSEKYVKILLEAGISGCRCFSG